MKEDIILAKESWRMALKHYTRVCKNIHKKYAIFCRLIEEIQQHNLDEVLHAETSHEMLIISTKHRYDAAVDKLRLELQEDTICFEYFSVKNAYRQPQVRECDIEHSFEILQELIAQLLNLAETSLA